MKKFLFILLCILAGAQAVIAEQAYVVKWKYHVTSGGVEKVYIHLSFHYDNDRNSGTWYTADNEPVYYDLNWANSTGGTQAPWWLDNSCQEIDEVYFESGFENARPTSTERWFSGMDKVKSIGHIERLNTSEVVTMAYMFANSPLLTNIDMSGFNTSKVYSMRGMFAGCTGLKTLDLSAFDTSFVADMSYMFSGLATGFTSLDLSNFSTDRLNDITRMFKDSHFKTIYMGSYWSSQNLNGNNVFDGCTEIVGGQGTAYDASHLDADYARVDAGTFLPGYFTYKGATREAYVVFSNKTFTFYYDGLRSTRSKNYAVYGMNVWQQSDVRESVWENLTKVVFDMSFAGYKPTSTHSWFYNCENLETIEGMQYLDTSETITMHAMFRDCNSLQSLDVSGFNTSNVTDMAYMFFGCSALKSIDVTGFDTKNVTTMQFMFGGLTVTSLNVSNFDTRNVTNMYAMFGGCSKLTNLNLNSFNTAKVENMSEMFWDCTSLTKLSLSYLFSTSNVTEMGWMFRQCKALTNFSFLTYFNTEKVEDMSGMFWECSSVETLDLSTFKTSNVTEMKQMFSECPKLTTVNIASGWNTDKVTESTEMFKGCTSIRGMQGTTYNESYVDKTYARLDEGTSKPGYLSTRTYGLKIGGVEVTDMNRDNIPIESGTAKFNGTSLFLTDATIGGTLTYGSIYCTRDNLTVIVNGTCTLNRPVIFRGSSLYFTSNKDTDVLTVKSYFDFKGLLQFYNKNTVISNSSTYTFMGDGTTSKLEFGPKATLFAMSTGKQVAIQVTDLTFKSPTSFTFGSLGVDDSQVSFDATQQTILMGGQPLQGALLIGQYYPLWFGDMQVSSTMPLYSQALLGQKVYDITEDSETLVLTTSPAFPLSSYDKTTFRSETENLRVELGSDWTVKMEDGSATTPAMRLYGNTTITGTGKLTIESSGLGIRIFGESHDLTIDGIDMEVTAAGNGIYGSSKLENNVYYYYNGVTFKNATATITSTGTGEKGYCLHHLRDLVLTGCRITNGVTFENNMINAPQVIIGLGSSYDLNNDGKVSTADIQVIINEMKKPQASQNMDYDLNGDGKISTADIQVIINEMKK